MKKKQKKKKIIKDTTPHYTLAEELINSISHGIGAGLAIAALVLMIVKSSTVAQVLCSITFGVTMIFLYTISCIYHALSSKLKGKRVLRVIDHCNVFLLVWGTYVPVAILGVKGIWGYALLAFVTTITIIGIILSCINLDKHQVSEVVCHLLNGWSITVAFKILLTNIGSWGVALLLAGGILYSVGALLYGIGAKKKYMHCVFHFFCLAASICHFLCVYLYIL